MSIPARRRWVPVLAVAVAILVASAVPAPTGGAANSRWVFTAGHLIGYGALSLSSAATLDGRLRSRLLAGVAIGVAVLFGLGVELLQLPLPTRDFALADLLANGAGAVVGALGWVVLGPRFRAQR